MKTIAVLLVSFIAIGVCTKTDNKWTRLCLIAIIVAMVAYVSIA
jgi:hypothetical protein